MNSVLIHRRQGLLPGLAHTFITDKSLVKLTCLMDRLVLRRGQGSEGGPGSWFHGASGITCQVVRKDGHGLAPLSPHLGE